MRPSQEHVFSINIHIAWSEVTESAAHQGWLVPKPPDGDLTFHDLNLIQPTLSLPLAAETKSPPKS